MTFKKCLIVAIPIQDAVKPPGALPILAACCEQTKVEYEILDLNLYMHTQFSEENLQPVKTDLQTGDISEATKDKIKSLSIELHSKIDHCQPDLLAISIFTFQSITPALLLLEGLRQHPGRANFSIVIGGLGVSSFHDKTATIPFGQWARQKSLTDFVIEGEGEISFCELLKRNFDYAGINGKPAKQILDLDPIPHPSYKKIDPRNYFFSSVPEVIVTGSKGCVRSCSFCDVGHYWKNYVYRRGELIALDLYQIWKDTGVLKFDFSDSLINGSLKNFRAMNKKLIELKKSNPDFQPTYSGQFICRPIGQMKLCDYEQMKDAGAETIVVGIEHFSYHIRRHMKKDFDNDSIDWHFETCARLGIKNVLLLLSGYLTESLEDHKNNLEYLQKYQIYAMTRIIYAINITVTGLGILPGAPLYDWLHDQYPEFDFNDKDYIFPDNPSLDSRERLRRGMETIRVAADLGYNVLHFNNKLEYVQNRLQYLNQNRSKTVWPIKVDQ